MDDQRKDHSDPESPPPKKNEPLQTIINLQRAFL